MEPSDIDRLTKDEIYHYEKELGLSAWRNRAERLARLEKLAQTNTLPHQQRMLSGAEGQQQGSLQEFLVRPACERSRVTAVELKRLERLAFIVDNEILSFAERKKRLLEQLWAWREAASPHGRQGQQAPLLAAWGLAPRRLAGAQDLDGEAAADAASEEERGRHSQRERRAVPPGAAGAVVVDTGCIGGGKANIAELAAAFDGMACCEMTIIDVPYD